MSIGHNRVIISIHGEPSVGIPSLQDEIELRWDLDEYPDERNRIRDIIRRAWAELYDDGIDVHFGDECPDCLGVGYHKPSCPLEVLEG